MVIVLFRSRLTSAAGQDYGAMAQEMVETARTMPGFLDVKSYQAEDGERLTVVKWQDEETLAAWREHARHRIAQRLGREKWYENFHLEVAHLVRSSEFQR
jgi:heme-degrading monooxygenase HmoA